MTIWFAVGADARIYLATLRMARDWPKNALAEPTATLEVGGEPVAGRVRLLSEERLRGAGVSALAQKYWGAWLAGWLGLRPEGVFEFEPNEAAS